MRFPAPPWLTPGGVFVSDPQADEPPYAGPLNVRNLGQRTRGS